MTDSKEVLPSVTIQLRWILTEVLEVTMNPAYVKNQAYQVSVVL